VRSLGLPDHFAETFHQRVQRRVRVAPGGAQPFVVRDDSRGLIDRQLLGDGEMQRQVQERIDVSLLGPIVAVQPRVGFEHRVVFRMDRDQPRGSRLEPG